MSGEELNIVHIARLARLSLTSEDEIAVRGDLESIIEMIDAMQSVATENVAPMANPLDATQRLRDDKVTENVERGRFQANAPSTDAGYYLVPRVIE
ncbi:MAG: Asp-tRNA(Asn)/Glu-tRNA(Gln) amidotransferase subunit GatC [Pseudomonadota bacterium]|nr:Asp-tRNA(Asn)/Glu-tRNA(Gln) amidotransferase subunit GatC [Pseudomonadota bacterium]